MSAYKNKNYTMPRIDPIDKKVACTSVRAALEKQRKLSDEPTSNMQATLAHSLPALEVYMQWNSLYAEVERILGKRKAIIFALAISKGSSCTYCETVFRKRFTELGEDADRLHLSEDEKDIYSFGEAVAKHHGNIANHLFNSLSRIYFTEELVVLTAFAGQMIAANIFNNVAETKIDFHLLKHEPPLQRCWS